MDQPIYLVPPPSSHEDLDALLSREHDDDPDGLNPARGIINAIGLTFLLLLLGVELWMALALLSEVFGG